MELKDGITTRDIMQIIATGQCYIDDSNTYIPTDSYCSGCRLSRNRTECGPIEEIKKKLKAFNQEYQVPTFDGSCITIGQILLTIPERQLPANCPLFIN